MLPGSELKIEGFRCFRSLTVGGLTRVNLIVGANNSGKTALLEAVELFATDVSETRLIANAERRGELYSHASTATAANGAISFDLRSLFLGRPGVLSAPNQFSISVGAGLDKVLVQSGKFERHGDNFVITHPPPDPEPGLRIKGRNTDKVRTVALGTEVGFSSEVAARLVKIAQDTPGVHFVPSGGVSSNKVRELWSGIYGYARLEMLVHDALALVDDSIERLVVAPAQNTLAGWDGVYLNQKGSEDRLPIASFGDGMKKITQLALSMVRSRGGILLTDEIDEGLHYTALPRLWRYVVESARLLGVQVFATTHGKDCLEAIARLYADNPALAADISVHRLDRDCERSVDTPAAQVASLLEAGMELR
jgi:AAA domain, putative AbiEii toxin, Type IV TA system/AAA ATPase domain